MINENRFKYLELNKKQIKKITKEIKPKEKKIKLNKKQKLQTVVYLGFFLKIFSWILACLIPFNDKKPNIIIVIFILFFFSGYIVFYFYYEDKLKLGVNYE